MVRGKSCDMYATNKSNIFILGEEAGTFGGGETSIKPKSGLTSITWIKV